MRGRNPIDIHVGSRLRLARRVRGLAQREVAGHLGVSFQQVQKYEKGASRIGAGRLYQLAHYLDISLGFFYDEMPEELQRFVSSTTETNKPALAPLEGLDLGGDGQNLELQRLVSAFLRIPDPHLRARLITFLGGLAQSFSERPSNGAER